MGLEGRKISDNKVMFGEPLDERVLEKLKRRSPNAESILGSLPASAFIPIQKTMSVVQEEQPVAEKTNLKKAKERRDKKKLRKKKQIQEKPIEKTIINTLIENKPVLEPNMNLEEELESLSQEVKVQAEVAEESFEEEGIQTDLKDQILTLLKGEPNAPSQTVVDAWKDQYGRSGIHAMAFGEGEVYIYHHLTRGEWKKLKELMTRLQESSNSNEIEEKLKEKVVLHCILFPKVDAKWLEMCKAGVIDSLYQMILLNSGFLTPQQAMLLTTQL